MKKTINAITFSLVLCVCLLAGCAFNPASADNRLFSSLSSDYDAILSLQTEGYQSLSLKNFNASVNAEIDKDIGFLSAFNDLMGILTTEDSVYPFVYETLSHSISEIISTQMGNAVSFSKTLTNYSGQYLGGAEHNEVFYDFMFTALYSVEYRVIDEAALTVGARDALLSAYQTALQNAILGIEKERLMADGVKAELQMIADDLADRLSADTLVFEHPEIQSIEIYDGNRETVQE